MRGIVASYPLLGWGRLFLAAFVWFVAFAAIHALSLYVDPSLAHGYEQLRKFNIRLIDLTAGLLELPDAHTVRWLGAIVLSLFPAFLGFCVYHPLPPGWARPFREWYGWNDPAINAAYRHFFLAWLCWGGSYRFFKSLTYDTPYEGLLVSVLVSLFGSVQPPASLSGYQFFHFMIFAFRALPAAVVGLGIFDILLRIDAWIYGRPRSGPQTASTAAKKSAESRPATVPHPCN